MKRIGIILALLCLALCLGGCGKEKKTYRKAEVLLEESSFAQAEELFSSLGDYEDAGKQLRECQYQNVKALLDADEPDYVQVVLLLNEIGAYKDAIALKAELQEQYFFAEYGYRIPGMECVVPDAQRADDNGTDENGSFHRYTYTWPVVDAGTAKKTSDLFVKWLDCVNKAAGVDAQPYLNGTYFLCVDDIPYGMVSTQKTDTSVGVTVVLYDEPME